MKGGNGMRKRLEGRGRTVENKEVVLINRRNAGLSAHNTHKTKHG